MHTNTQYDDVLYLIRHPSSQLISLFIKFMQQVCQKDGVKWLDDGSLSIDNKYFKSRVDINTYDSISFDNLPAIENFILFIDNMDQYYDLMSKTSFRHFFGKDTIKFKLLIIPDDLVSKINTEQFYNAIEGFVPIVSIDLAETYDSVNNNIEVIEEIVDMIANNLWNSQNNKPKVHASTDDHKENLDDMIHKEENFMNVYDEMVTFMSKKKDLSPNSKKQQASDLIMKLMENMDFDEAEDLEES